jgi:phage tail-like protein
MDVNGTRFHLVLGHDDWLLPGADRDGAHWNGQDDMLQLEPLPIVFPPRKAERRPGPEDRRGAGMDRFGNWYWIGDDGRSIVARSRHDRQPLPFWPAPESAACLPRQGGDFAPADPPPPPLPPRLQGLAVTTEHYLVTGNVDEPGLLVFDLAGGGPPVMLRWPVGVPFVSYDLCAAPDGGVWLLDRRHARLWSLDRLLRVREAVPSWPVAVERDFAPAVPPPPDPVGAPARSEAPAAPLRLADSLDVSSVLEPSAVEALCDGSALVLGRDGIGPVLHHFTLGAGETGAYPLAPLLDEHPRVLDDLSHGHEFAFVPAPGCAGNAVAGQVFVVALTGNQSFAFTLSGRADELRVKFDRQFFPMRRHGGRALVAAGGEAHYDSGSRWVSLLEYPRPNFARKAVLLLPTRALVEPGIRAFDGREPGCVWHRIFLDACIPPEASVTIESRADDDPARLEALDWSPEPAPYLRSGGPELPFRAADAAGSRGEAGTWELLFQNAVGRYLQLRVTVTGNGRITPKIRSLRVYYPRFSYLREYLPAAYREDAASAWFLDRYLANVEGVFTGVEDRIAAAQLLFDTRTVPPEFLDWLAGWMGAALDTSWSERKKRFFLANVTTMFAARGTRDGMIRALRLALEDGIDPHLFGDGVDAVPPTASTGCGCGGRQWENAGARFTVRVVERFLTRDAPGVAYGDVGDLVGPGTTTTALDWTPAQGPEPLHRRWREWLAARYADISALKEAWAVADAGGAEDMDYTSFEDARLELPPSTPSGAARAADWRRFLRAGLGFTYAEPNRGTDRTLWQDFLSRRHRQPGDLARAWAMPKEAVATFDAIDFPVALPENRAALADWITFVSVVVPMRRGAHRFTVLVPVRPDDTWESQQQRRDLARRIAALEKPSHTTVETRLYWAAFRVGEARLGTDTLLGQGSRFTSLVLDRGELAASHLGWTEPWNVRGRLVVGRDPVIRRSHSGSSPRWT